MSIYDEAHALAKSMRNTEEYREYEHLRGIAYGDATNKALLDEYKKLQFGLQVSMASGKSADSDEMDRLQKIAALLQYNSDASAYLMAEIRFQKLLGDIYKILGDAAGLDMDFLQGR